MAKTKAVAPSKPVAAKPNPDRAPNALQVYREGEESPVDSMVRVAASPIARGASTARKFASDLFGETDVTAYVKRLSDQSQAVVDGDLSALERMLTTQAGTLDAIFNSAASRSAQSSHVPAQESFMRMALRAQAQCANTVKVIGELKNSKSIAFIRQQNNAANQQINNGMVPSTVPRAHEKDAERANELLTDRSDGQYGETLDAGTKGRTGRRDPALAAVATVDGTAK